MSSQPVSPWSEACHKALSVGSGPVPLLIFGPVGSLPIECAKKIHEMTGGGSFERIICTPDSVQLRTQVFGTTLVQDEEFPLFDPEPPTGALQRAIGGTLFFDNLERCNQIDVDWIRALIDRQPVMVNGIGIGIELDPSTRVIASSISSWVDSVEYALPQWLTALFGERVIVLEPLGHAQDVSNGIHWFTWQAVQGVQLADSLWSDEAIELLLGRPWPGDYEELRSVVNSLVSASAARNLIDLELCQRILANYDKPGMKPIDNYRRQECVNYAQGIVYIGKPLRPSEIYDWIEQFSKIAEDRRYDPWSVGLRIAREISHRYYYSSDQLRILIRNAYDSLCRELKAKRYLPNWSSGHSEDHPSGLRALLVNPLGPVKSAAGVLPHMSHLLRAGFGQQVVPMEKLAEQLCVYEDIQVVLFCDDFSGTGKQIVERLVTALGNDSILRGVCQRRCQIGKPVILGVVLAVGFGDALSNIRMSAPSWLPTFAHAGVQLDESDQAFSENSRIFPESEFRYWAKTLVLDRIGMQLSPNWPGGFGDLQALVVTSDNAPNDTLPAVWRSGSVQGMAWRALFDRASSPST